MIRATIICWTEKADVCKIAPIDMMITPIIKVFFLPMVSPGITYINHRSQMLRARFTKYKSGHGTRETGRDSEDKDLENV